MLNGIELIKNILTTLGHTYEQNSYGFCGAELVSRDHCGRYYVIDFRDAITNLILTEGAVRQFIEKLKTNEPKIDMYLLVTPLPPAPGQRDAFYKINENSVFDLKWTDINNFSATLEEFVETVSKKEVKEFITDADSKFSEEKKQPADDQKRISPATSIGIDLFLDAFEKIDDEEHKKQSEEHKIITYECRKLNRQFSGKCIEKLSNQKRKLEDILKIGDKSGNTIVVFSDIQNFSSIIRAAAPDIFKDFMSIYYSEARKLVWNTGGTLDKFIGDAVLAIFNYPFHDPMAVFNAIELAEGLIALGDRVLTKLTKTLDEDIPTGTRVGIALGDIWVLNIGNEDIEVSFVGNTINLASRLEGASEVNGILISHNVHEAIIKINKQYLDKFKITEKTLRKNEVKGLLADIRAFQLKRI